MQIKVLSLTAIYERLAVYTNLIYTGVMSQLRSAAGASESAYNRAMVAPSNKFGSPPVIETVLAVQFSRLSNYSSALAGLFWRDNFPSGWTTISDMPTLLDAQEVFGEEVKWAQPQIQFSPGDASSRTQIVRDDEERTIQVQASRFVLNWRRKSGAYPSFNAILPEFNASFGQFSAFAMASGLGKISPNHWEVTYVNQLPKGELWETVDDWKNIFPCISAPTVQGSIGPENQGADWRYVIRENLARLYITLRYARVSADGPDPILLQLTARGRVIDGDASASLESGFNLGHGAIVDAFVNMTSHRAHLHWRMA
jgi:uncharacterized protein (TIGR04255 family)